MGWTSSHVRKNRLYWDRVSQEYQQLHGRQLNRWDRPAWGVWGIPESKLRLLGEVCGLDVLEYGCGAGQWSMWLARADARPAGLDLSIHQLRHASEHTVVVRPARVGAEVPRGEHLEGPEGGLRCGRG